MFESKVPSPFPNNEMTSHPFTATLVKRRPTNYDRTEAGGSAAVGFKQRAGVSHLRTPVNNIEYFPPNFEGLVLGCIDADFCK